MMKKFPVIFMILLYGITATGFAMSVSFCSGTDVTSVKINVVADKYGPDNEKIKGCSDKKVELKVKEARQTEAASKTTGIFSFELPGFSLSDFVPAAHQALLEKLFDKTPPPPPPAPKEEPLLKNRKLRI